MPPYEVLLIRHGETRGYHDDVGLTERGEAQAAAKGGELAAALPAGTRVRMPHAPTARGTATAVTLRAALLAALAPGSDVVVGPLEPDHHFDSLQFLFDGAARESSGVAAHRLRLRGDGGDGGDGGGLPPPDWAAEYDRFDTDYGAGSALGGPIDRWMTATTRHFEPPQVTVYRAWAGIVALGGAVERPGTVALVSSHSALLRAVAAAALGHDPGEPANLEHVAVRVDPDAGRARVLFRDGAAEVGIPDRVPPWLSPAYLAGERRAAPWP